MDRPPCFVLLRCGFRCRNWVASPLVRHRIPRYPNPFVPPRLFPKAPARFAHGWIRILRRFVKPPTGRPSTPEPLNARPSSKSRTNGSRRWSVFASSNSLGARLRPPRRWLRRCRVRRADIPPCRPRGQLPGRPGPNRRDYSHLPAVVDPQVFPPEKCRCSRCGQPFADFPGTEDSTILEVEVRAHRRIIHRHRYRPTCSCGAHSGIVTAPPPPRLIPKSILGVSIWVTILLDKYLFYRPTYRLLADWSTLGLDLSLGTVTDGLKHLVPLLEPVYEALVKRSQGQTLWHADETRWQVFVMFEGKVGYRWYLWVFHSREVVIFILASGRSHDVPEEHLGPVQGPGIMVVDRYKAYQAVDKVKNGLIVLAFCWAHVRRDFLTMARSWPDQEAWAMGWVERIGELYRLNDARLKVRANAVAFATADGALREAVTAFGASGQVELEAPDPHPARRKVMESLGNHWTGLTVFVEHPEVPMDNNTAERSQRGPVVGRKNYYGSGSVWSGRLAAMTFSLFQTLCLWGLNPRLWLTAYLEACAKAGGRAVADVDRFMPWNLSPEQRRALGCEDEIPASDTS